MELSIARSFLFAPGNEERKLRKALAVGADAVIADLEDGVSPERRDEAREVVERVLSVAGTPSARLLRVNPPETEWFAEDLALAGRLELDAIVLPKATPSSVAALGAGPPVLAIVESAAGLSLVAETARLACVFALALGSHDLGAELRLTQRDDQLELLFARSQVVLASAAAGLRAPVDTVRLDIGDEPGLVAECRLARTLGFRGKLCIHPAQLDAVHDVFAPSESELEWARRVLDAHEQGLREGRGAVALDGRMIDMPIVRQAERLLAEAGGGGDG